MSVQTEAKKTFGFLELITGTLLFLGAVFTSFIWIPVVGAVSALAALAGAGLWIMRRVWSWYDSCYPLEFDRMGRPHPYMRVMTGIGRPSSGMMGGRESDRLVPFLPSVPRLQKKKDQRVEAETVQAEIEQQRYRYGA